MAPGGIPLKRIHPKDGIGRRKGRGPRGGNVDILTMQVMALVTYRNCVNTDCEDSFRNDGIRTKALVNIPEV